MDKAGASSGARLAQAFKKLLGWLVAIVVIVAVLAWLAYKRDDYKTFREDLTTYEGVTIGSTKDEVRYAVGMPKAIYGPETWDAEHKWAVRRPINLTPGGDLPGTTQTLPGGSALQAANEWIYEGAENFTVTFDPKTGRVTQVQCLTSDDPVKECSSNLWVSSYTPEKGIRDQLGEPGKEQLTGGFKSIEYPKLGLRLMLAKREIYSVAKTKPENVGLAWWLQHRLF